MRVHRGRAGPRRGVVLPAGRRATWQWLAATMGSGGGWEAGWVVGVGGGGGGGGTVVPGTGHRSQGGGTWGPTGFGMHIKLGVHQHSGCVCLRTRFTMIVPCPVFLFVAL